jgi:XapX domain-containing protein
MTQNCLDLGKYYRAKREGLLRMKVLFVSFVVGLFVGVLYGVIRVKSPAPPIVALLGLLGMVLGEQLGGWILAKKINLTQAASVCIVNKHWGGQAESLPAPQRTTSAD